MRWIIDVIVIAAMTLPAAAQESAKRKTVLEGVFTAAQAERGKEAYALHCSSCHSEDLQGLAAPPLKDQQLLDNWREDSANSLFMFIKTRMPNRAPGSLSAETYLDILAYVFSVNMFPTGSKELTIDALENIDVVGKDGPAPIPKFALITAVGCLTKSGDEWTLEKASAPRRTRQEKPTPAEVKTSAAKPLGAGTFRLV